jgi:hypothetical protein
MRKGTMLRRVAQLCLLVSTCVAAASQENNSVPIVANDEPDSSTQIGAIRSTVSADSFTVTEETTTQSAPPPLQRKRTTNASAREKAVNALSYAAASADATADTGSSLEQIWEKEAALAHKELERMLLLTSGSLPSSPAPVAPFFPTPVVSSTAPVTKVPTTSPAPNGGGLPASATPSLVVVGQVASAVPTLTRTPTPPPVDCLVGRTPEQFLLDTLSAITSVNLLLNPATAQGMAFNYILSDPTIQANVCAYPTIPQRYALGMCRVSTIRSDIRI